jgi:ferrochelatase
MNEVKKTAVLLLNVGTPDSPEVKDVRRYLKQFLNDPRVIDIPVLARLALVNLIIVPFRAPKSAKLYRELFTGKGSPLVYYTAELADKLNAAANNNTRYFFAMRYQNPSIKKVLDRIVAEKFDHIKLFPLFPQYASSTTGTALEAVYSYFKGKPYIAELSAISQFYDYPAFIDTFAERIRRYKPEEYDHVILSYHGLPVRHVNKIHPGMEYSDCTCHQEMPEHGKYCYRATCYETSRLLAKKLGLGKEDYTVSFQSRLSDKWLKPFTDETLLQLAKEGRKKVLIAAPSFVTDCLETIIELGLEYKKLFTENGGEKLEMVESLNDMDLWVDTVRQISAS